MEGGGGDFGGVVKEAMGVVAKGQGEVAKEFKEQIAKEKRKAPDAKSAGTQHRHPRGKSPPPAFSSPWGLLAITSTPGAGGGA
jgi:hypothetical protein